MYKTSKNILLVSIFFYFLMLPCAMYSATIIDKLDDLSEGTEDWIKSKSKSVDESPSITIVKNKESFPKNYAGITLPQTPKGSYAGVIKEVPDEFSSLREDEQFISFWFKGDGSENKVFLMFSDRKEKQRGEIAIPLKETGWLRVIIDYHKDVKGWSALEKPNLDNVFRIRFTKDSRVSPRVEFGVYKIEMLNKKEVDEILLKEGPLILKLQSNSDIEVKGEYIKKSGEFVASIIAALKKDEEKLKLVCNSDNGSGYYKFSGYDFSFLGQYEITFGYEWQHKSDNKKDIVMKMEFLDINEKIIDNKTWKYTSGEEIQNHRFVTPERAVSGYVYVYCNNMKKGDVLLLIPPKLSLLTPKDVAQWINVKNGNSLWQAKWIAPKKEIQNIYFRKSIQLDKEKLQSLKIQITITGAYKLYFNGTLIGEQRDFIADTREWRSVEIYDLTEGVKTGSNLLGIEAVKAGRLPIAIIAEVFIKENNKETILITDGSWKYSEKKMEGWLEAKFDAESWENVKVIGGITTAPWEEQPWANIKHIDFSLDCTVVGLELPKEIKSGEIFKFTATFVTNSGFTTDKKIRIKLCRGKDVFFYNSFFPELNTSQWQKNEKIIVESPQMLLPAAIPGGDYEVQVDVGRDCLINCASYIQQKIKIVKIDKKYTFPKSEFIKKGQMVSVKINDEKYPPVYNQMFLYDYLFVHLDDPWEQLYTYIRNSVKAGVHMYHIDAGDFGWKGKDLYDYTRVDAIMSFIISADPKARIFFAYWLDPRRNHRFLMDIIPKDESASRKDKEGVYWDGTIYVPSYASETWRTLYKEAVSRFIRHLKEEGFSEHVVGFMPAVGHSGDGGHWDYHYAPENFTDYSPAMQRAFQKWCRAKYRNDVSALRNAWNDNKIGFDNIEIPSPNERIQTDYFVFRNPAQSQRLIDFYIFWNEVPADFYKEFAKAIKDDSEGALLFGCFRGGLFLIEHPRLLSNYGTLYVSDVMLSEDIDFGGSPFGYVYRLEESDPLISSTLDSWKLYDGKHSMVQADMRTVWAQGVQGDRFRGKSNLIYTLNNKIYTAAADAITRGQGIQWYDFSYGWMWGDLRIAEAIGKTTEIYNTVLNAETESTKELALIMSEDYVCYQSVDKPFMNTGWQDPVNAKILFYLKKSGIPLDIYTLSDLPNIDTSQYKMYIFPNACHLTEEQRRIIKEKIQCDDKIVVFFHAPGLIDDNSISIERMNSLIGMDVEMIAEEQPMELRIIQSNSPVVEGLNGLKFGNNLGKWGPIFNITDKKAVELGVLEATNKTIFGLKRLENWTTVYSMIPIFNSEIYRRLARIAGIHVYYKYDEPFYIGNNIIGLHTKKGGKRTIDFPHKVDIYDFIEDKWVGKKINKFEQELEPGKTLLLLFRKSL